MLLCATDDDSCPVAGSEKCRINLATVACAYLQRNQQDLPQFCKHLLDSYEKEQ